MTQLYDIWATPEGKSITHAETSTAMFTAALVTTVRKYKQPDRQK